jgi:hypothetical protein
VETLTSRPSAPVHPAAAARGVLLDSWVAHAWQDGVQVGDLWAGDRLVVRTVHSTYALTVLEPGRCEIAVRGGHFFPREARARLDGSSLGRGFIKLGGIYVGFSMELRTAHEVIVTSRVRSIGYVQHG